MGKAKKVGIGIGIAFGAFIVLAIVAAAVTTNQNDTVAAPENELSQQDQQVTQTSIQGPKGTQKNPAGMNETVTLDGISYTLTAVSNRSGIIFEEADGQFIVITLRIVNIGTESETLYHNTFKLIDSRGRSFESDFASVHLEGDIFALQVNPDVPTTGRLAFDVPTTPDSYLLQISSHKTFGSGPVYLNVGST